jgi:hypothetical protein
VDRGSDMDGRATDEGGCSPTIMQADHAGTRLAVDGDKNNTFAVTKTFATIWDATVHSLEIHFTATS